MAIRLNGDSLSLSSIFDLPSKTFGLAKDGFFSGPSDREYLEKELPALVCLNELALDELNRLDFFSVSVAETLKSAVLPVVVALEPKSPPLITKVESPASKLSFLLLTVLEMVVEYILLEAMLPAE